MDDGQDGKDGEDGKEGESDDDGQPEPPEHFEDRAMIDAAYPLLYGRDVTEEEAALGLEFLEAQRAAHRAEATEGADPALADRQASHAAWVQYARALFSAAEFRFIG